MRHLVTLLLLLGIAGSSFACGGDKAAPEAATQAAAAPVKEAVLSPAEQKVAQGAELYGRMCKVCHGADGEGYKADHAPQLANAQYLAAVSDELLHASIAHGRAGTPMSAWAVERGGPLAKHDIEAIIAFMRGWYKGARADLDQAPLQGNAAAGLPLYTQHCVKCHGDGGMTGPNNRIGDHELLASASNGFLRYSIAKGRAGTPMLGFEGPLGKQGIEDVIAYLRSVAIAQGAPKPSASPAKPPPIPLGPVPLNPKGPDPEGFKAHPGTTSTDVIAKQLKAGARMAFLDARAPSDYTNEHIKGAVSVPFYDPSPYLDQLPKDSWLVCYCACPHAESRELAGKLSAAGFTKVTVLDEGLGVWKSKGHATSTGMQP